MYELNAVNPDVMRAELAYRRERISAGIRADRAGRHRRLRARRHPGRARNS